MPALARIGPMSTPTSLRTIMPTTTMMTPLTMLLSRLPSVWARCTRRVAVGSSSSANASLIETPPTDMAVRRCGRIPTSACRTIRSIIRWAIQRVDQSEDDEAEDDEGGADEPVADVVPDLTGRSRTHACGPV